MNLRLRLALSYLAVIGLFLLTLAVCHALLTVPAANNFRDESLTNWRTRWGEALEQAYRRGGWDEVARQAQNIELPPFAELTLRAPGQPDRTIRPRPQGPPPNGHGFSPPGNVMLRFPGDQKLAVGEGGELSIQMRPPPPSGGPRDIRNQLLWGLILSAAAGALVAFLAGLWLSSSISGPVQKLASATRDLGELDLDRRVEITGQGELADLGRGFNQMAARLQETVRHLSEEKRRVERLELNQRQFLSDVSHNLRTPLAAVLGWTEALQEGIGQGDELEKIHREVLYVSQTLQRLVDLSRWESSEPHLQHRTFDLREPLGLVVDTLAPAAETRQVQLEMEGTSEAVMVSGDAGRVRELLQILLENAVYHAGAGTIVQLRVERGQRVTVSLQDDGCGFDPSATRGLGLPIARRLARAHGGELQLVSSPGQGTRARISLAPG